MLFGLEFLLVPIVFAVTAPVVVATSAVIAAPAVILSPLMPMVFI